MTAEKQEKVMWSVYCLECVFVLSLPGVMASDKHPGPSFAAVMMGVWGGLDGFGGILFADENFQETKFSFNPLVLSVLLLHRNPVLLLDISVAEETEERKSFSISLGQSMEKLFYLFWLSCPTERMCPLRINLVLGWNYSECSVKNHLSALCSSHVNLLYVTDEAKTSPAAVASH